jgi:hypothetical protein
MYRRLSATFFSTLGFLLLTGCGGGGGSGTSGLSSTGSSTALLAASTAIVDGTTIGTSHWASGPTASGGKGQAIGSLTCGPAGAAYSYAHLTISLNGRLLSIPENIGVVGPTIDAQTGCVYPLHTNDASGKIRFDTTAGGPFTLGQFFAAWGQPLSSANVAGLTGLPIVAYINDGGNLTQYTGDLSNIELTAHREITIQVGSALPQIPTYAWSDPPPLLANPIWLGLNNVIGTQHWPDGAGDGSQGETTSDGIQCAAGMAETYHVHTHLAIIKDGEMLALPANIGIPGSCNYEMHTHDLTGVIHMEAPAFKRFTLGNFFSVWNKTLSRTDVAGLTGQPVVAYINDGGDVRQYTGNLANIELISHRSVTIQIGAPLKEIPTYRWDGPK